MSRADQQPGVSTLQMLIREPRIKTTNPRALILLHGVGGNEDNLFNLVDSFPADAYVFAVRGYYTLSPGKYAWFQVDFSTGKPVYNQTQELASRLALIELIKQLKQQYQLSDIYIGGFSQGAIMGYTIGLTNPDLVTGVIGMSGRILQEIRPTIKPTEALSALKVFVAHGINDAVLPIHYAHDAKSYLTELGVNLTYHEYSTGHQLIAEELQDLNAWLS